MIGNNIPFLTHIISILYPRIFFHSLTAFSIRSLAAYAQFPICKMYPFGMVFFAELVDSFSNECAISSSARS